MCTHTKDESNYGFNFLKKKYNFKLLQLKIIKITIINYKKLDIQVHDVQ